MPWFASLMAGTMLLSKPWSTASGNGFCSSHHQCTPNPGSPLSLRLKTPHLGLPLIESQRHLAKTLANNWLGALKLSVNLPPWANVQKTIWTETSQLLVVSQRPPNHKNNRNNQSCIPYIKSTLPSSGLWSWTAGWLRGSTGVVQKAIAV